MTEVADGPADRRRGRRRPAVDLVAHLVVREFRLRYRRALLGWLWVIAQPLARLVVLSFVFTRVLPLGIDDYPAFLFTGLIAWQWFSSGVSAATASAVDRADLLLRPGVPRAVVPVVSVLADGFDFLAALPVLAVFLLLSGGVPWTAVALPAIVVVQLLLTAGLGFALCAANVHLRDVRLLVDLALVLGFYATPVFYSADELLRRYPLVVRLNPMARLLDAYRDVLVEGVLPAPGPFLALAAVCAAICGAGYAVYRVASPTFVDEL